MTRYLTGILAVVIAIGAVAFTTPSKHFTMVTFTYTPPTSGDYSQPSVQDKDNWDPAPTSCQTGSQRACTLEVNSTHTTGGGTELSSDVSITAAEGSLPGKYYVSGGTNISSFQNKQ